MQRSWTLPAAVRPEAVSTVEQGNALGRTCASLTHANGFIMANEFVAGRDRGADRGTGMWVRVADWLLVDDAPHRPAPGDVLRQVGICIRGQLHPAHEGEPDLVDGAPDPDTASPMLTYALTGTATHPHDLFEAIPNRRWPHRKVTTRLLGTRLTLSVNGQHYWADVPGPADAITPGTRVTVTGPPTLIGWYEWEDPDNDDIRADWTTTQVRDLPDGGILVDLTPTPRPLT